ncbi:UDP-N-acetylmuramoyl-tripeptide--D-alanyl-D-alanine ligase [Paenibacillus rhizovicinus]|uniref:UDP-N-acetylmuramoyl-tripeptide--D-alanyl-D-alanine ligase n=1 Tax=Paenibacillus rhizovicinus TaxID=2704463 RepID=A0A6C0NW03_9BACL|nr:UDP-N-acetylmuramoyl-tripeptide--D-alanyl-D-alanine ligase [Paenibacillus rhizovicinus]QHW30380.1 UDP-N-acetylmuramoyl-tripeptide--D-alanyl-D-alanine ligase [Paenibacillus rhizovicinus]
MIKRPLNAIAALCGGTMLNDNGGAEIIGVSINTRTLKNGQLFVPILGERVDGHDFVADALTAGAGGALWQRSVAVPDVLSDAPLILVDDTVEALQQLAANYRDGLELRVVGVTGSNGKTTTKDMVAALLSGSFRVHKTEGNLNNHIGLPLTVLELDETVDAVVLEMGMSEFGEIDFLTRLAKPDVAIITNIGDSHMLQLGSRAGIAKAKLEIVAGLRPGGLLLMNGDEPLLHEGVRSVQLPDGVDVQTFGLQDGSRWVADNISVDATSSMFDVKGDAELQRVLLPVAGRHNVSNALAAIAAAKKLGVPADVIRKGFEQLKLTSMRIEPSMAHNGAMVLNDAYNASPTSVRAAIDVVDGLQGYRHKWLVLGDMLELGPQENEMHGEIGAYITPSKADAVLTFGAMSQHTAAAAAKQFAAAGLEERVRAFEDKQQLAEWLLAQLQPEDLVLVKGSRGMRMEEVVHALQRG